MKLIKAYIRTFMADDVIRALKDLKIHRLTTIDVKKVGDEIETDQLAISAELGSTYTTMVKLELVCNDDCVPMACDIIRENARTGHKGDGLITVSPLEEVIRIRSGGERPEGRG